LGNFFSVIKSRRKNYGDGLKNNQNWREYSAQLKLTPLLGCPTPVLNVKVKQGESVIWLFWKINISTVISMERSRRELSIDMVIHWGI